MSTYCAAHLHIFRRGVQIASMPNSDQNELLFTGKADELLNSPPSSSANNPNPSKTSVAEKTPTYVLPSNSFITTKPKPLNIKRASNLSEESKKNLLFAGLDEKGESFSEDPFKMKTFPSVKKLNLKVFKAVKNNLNEKNGTNAIEQVL